MKFGVVKANIMSQLGIGQDLAELESFNGILPKLSKPHQAELIAPLLQEGKAGVILKEGNLFLAPLEQCGNEGLTALFDLLADPAIPESVVESIFRSAWVASFTLRDVSEKESWIIAYYLLRKKYVALFIEALQNKKAFKYWREVPFPELGGQIPLKELILKVLFIWPTSGRSGYTYLEKLIALPALQPLLQDLEVKSAYQKVIGFCDFAPLSEEVTA